MPNQMQLLTVTRLCFCAHTRASRRASIIIKQTVYSRPLHLGRAECLYGRFSPVVYFYFYSPPLLSLFPFIVARRSAPPYKTQMRAFFDVGRPAYVHVTRVVRCFIAIFRKRFGFHGLSGKCFPRPFVTRRPLCPVLILLSFPPSLPHSLCAPYALYLIMIEGSIFFEWCRRARPDLKSIKYHDPLHEAPSPAR